MNKDWTLLSRLGFETPKDQAKRPTRAIPNSRTPFGKSISDTDTTDEEYTSSVYPSFKTLLENSKDDEREDEADKAAAGAEGREARLNCTTAPRTKGTRNAVSTQALTHIQMYICT